MHSSSTLHSAFVGCLLLLTATATKAQFTGGNDDGTHSSQGSSQPLGRNIFLGGNDDGSSVSLAFDQPVGRNIFLGGNDDGSSVSLALDQSVGRNIFLGGNDDGSNVSVAFDQLVGRNIFLGGNNDGSSVSLAADQLIGRTISLGGSGDGWVIALKATTTPLPVTLTDFSGRWQQHDAVLSWQTASEVNSSHFELERSFDGRAFTQIQRVAAAGQSSSPRSYQHTDANISALLPPGVTVIYYRLRSVDITGEATYSGVVVLTATHKASGSAIEYAVFPNPAQDQVTITASQLPAAAGTTICLLDVTGRVLLRQPMTSGRQQLSVSAMANGVYFLQLLAAGKVVYTQRILISK